MGYRHRFYLVENETLNKINKMSAEEFYKWGTGIGLNESIEYEAPYIPLYKIGSNYFDFGKWYENAKEIQATGRLLFTDTDLLKRYGEYGAHIVGKEAVLCAIKWQKQHIVDYYEKLLGIKEVDEFEKLHRKNKQITDEERFRMHIEDMYSEWKNPFEPEGFAVDLDENDPRISTSSKYEYSIFELVRLYKSTDWNKYGLIFMGW